MLELTNTKELITVRILKEATCPSLSNRSTITYQIGCNETNAILFRIHKNSGTGKFNREWVSAADMLAKPKQPRAAKTKATKPTTKKEAAA